MVCCYLYLFIFQFKLYIRYSFICIWVFFFFQLFICLYKRCLFIYLLFTYWIRLWIYLHNTSSSFCQKIFSTFFSVELQSWFIDLFFHFYFILILLTYYFFKSLHIKLQPALLLRISHLFLLCNFKALLNILNLIVHLTLAWLHHIWYVLHIGKKFDYDVSFVEFY